MSIFPTVGAGGLEIRDGDGNPTNPPNVENAYVPAPAYVMTCNPTALSSDCFAKVEPEQVNNIVSEMLCLAETLAPEGVWDCDSLCNLATAFNTWLAGFTGGDTNDICLAPEGDGTEVDAALVYCDGAGNILKFPIYGDDSLFEAIFASICSTATAGDADNPLDTLLYCDNTGTIRKVNAFSFQFFRGPFVQAYGYEVGQMVEREGRLWSPNAAIPPGTAFVEGVAGATWYEVSPSSTVPYDPAISYSKDTIINKDGLFYAANEDIPPGTPFVVGVSGQTWRQIDFTQAFINEFDPGLSYAQNGVVTLGGVIYRATAGPVPPGAFDPLDWELLGGERSRYRGDYNNPDAYQATDMVMNFDRLYIANAAIPAATPFVVGTAGATWREVSKNDLVDFSDLESYPIGSTRVNNAQIYRAIINVGPGPFNPAEWEQIGGDRSIYRGTWVMANEYKGDDLVLNTGLLYKANANIPAGTPFTIGAVGATWTQIGSGTATPVVPDFNAGASYLPFELTTAPDNIYSDPAIWRAKAGGHPAGAFDPADFDVLGERNVYRGLKQSRVYKTNDVVHGLFLDGLAGFLPVTEFYRATAAVPDSNNDSPYDSALFIPMTKVRGNHNTFYRYFHGDLVFNQYGVFRANDNIAAGAGSVVVGVTGATWAPQNNVQVVTIGGTVLAVTADLWNKYCIFNGAGTKTLTVPANATIAFPVGTTISGVSQNGQLTIAAAGGVTVQTPDTLALRNVDFAAFTLVKVGTNVWHLSGDLA